MTLSKKNIIIIVTGFIIAEFFLITVYYDETFNSVRRLFLAKSYTDDIRQECAQRNFSASNVSLASEQRKQRIESLCNSVGNLKLKAYQGNTNDNFVLFNSFADIQHNILFCQVQKVSSSFWKFTLQFLQNTHRFKSIFDVRLGDINVPSLQKVKLSQLELQAFLSKSFKFMFVRDPFCRLFSGYMDKLFSINPLYWRDTGDYIVHNIRKKSTNTNSYCGHDVTFTEFVDYLITTQITLTNRDRHFTPMYEHCWPCQMNYDFIGKLETFTEDAEYVLKTISEKLNVNFPMSEIAGENEIHDINSKTKALFSSKPAVERCMSFFDGIKRVWRNLQARGILGKNVTIPFTEEYSQNITESDFLSIVLVAYEQSGNREFRKVQKKEALMEAYRSVSDKNLVKLQEIFKPDCDLFGYDNKPTYLFDKTANKAKDNFRYLAKF